MPIRAFQTASTYWVQKEIVLSNFIRAGRKTSTQGVS